MNKKEAQIFFKRRGLVKETLRVGDQEYTIKLKIFTNLEADALEEEFATVNEIDNSLSVDGSRLVEERLLRSILDAPFDCPVSDNEFIPWKDATEDQKRIALRNLDPKIREVILKRVSLMNSLDGQEVSFL